MAVGASRGSLSLAVAAIVAACPLWQVALALSTGDILFVNDPSYDINDRFLGRLAITGYSPSGAFRGSIDLSGITDNGTAISEVGPLTLSPDGQFAFLAAHYYIYTSAGDLVRHTAKLIVADIHSAKAKVVAVLAIPFPEACSDPDIDDKDGASASLEMVTAPGPASGTYTLYTNPNCGNTEITSRIAVLAFVYDVQHRTLKLQRELLYRGGALKDSPTLALQSQSYDRLFTVGRTLFALLSNVSDENPHSLLHLDSETGVILSHYVAYSASEEEQMCSDHLLNSPSSLYALCYVRLAPQTYRLQVKFFAKFKASVVIVHSDNLPYYDFRFAMASLGETSRFLTIATLPSLPAAGPAPKNTSVTITKLSRTTGKVVHSFTRPFFGFRVTGLAIVPLQD